MLSEINNTDKSAKEPLSSSAMVRSVGPECLTLFFFKFPQIGVVRKAIQRRVRSYFPSYINLFFSLAVQQEAAVKYKEANRPDLAEKEQKEVDLLNSILPPLLTVEQIDEHLKAVIKSLPPGSNLNRSIGVIFKEFYARVDQGSVTGDLVKQRIKVVAGANV